MTEGQIIFVMGVVILWLAVERKEYMLKCKELEKQLEDKKQEMIDKACAYLKDNRYEVLSDDPCLGGYIQDEFIDDFRESMNEQIKIEL